MLVPPTKSSSPCFIKYEIDIPCGIQQNWKTPRGKGSQFAKLRKASIFVWSFSQFCILASYSHLWMFQIQNWLCLLARKNASWHLCQRLTVKYSSINRNWQGKRKEKQRKTSGFCSHFALFLWKGRSTLGCLIFGLSASNEQKGMWMMKCSERLDNLINLFNCSLLEKPDVVQCSWNLIKVPELQMPCRDHFIWWRGMIPVNRPSPKSTGSK